MILLTVGTTMPFDELLEEMDRLIEIGAVTEQVICQRGQSAYRMKHAEHFMARPSIADLIADSSMVISHGGATVIELLFARKSFVAFPNPRGAGDHQTSFLARIAMVANISWDRDVEKLGHLINERRLLGPATVLSNLPRAADVLREIL